MLRSVLSLAPSSSSVSERVDLRNEGSHATLVNDSRHGIPHRYALCASQLLSLLLQVQQHVVAKGLCLC